jgi:hypothetical protein
MQRTEDLLTQKRRYGKRATMKKTNKAALPANNTSEKLTPQRNA